MFGYTDKAISKWEKGDTLPDVETLYQLASFYGVTIDYLTNDIPLEEKEIITAKSTNRGLVYIINYSKDGKYYVTIHHRILKNLLRYTNKDAMKVYILLKIQCDLLKNTRPMTNAYLCSLLGYPTNNNRNIDNMGKWTNTLANNGFIEKIQSRAYDYNENGKKVITRVDTYYKINDLETWNKKKDKGVINL